MCLNLPHTVIKPDGQELIQSVSRGDMLSRCFKEVLRLELTSGDLHSLPALTQNTLPNELC